MKPIDISDATFSEEVLSSHELVVVDFWAPWCAPCRMIAPVLEEIASEFQGKVKVVKVNTDENQALAAQHRIMSIPTLLFFRNGEIVDKVVGVSSKSLLIDKINYFSQTSPVLN